MKGLASLAGALLASTWLGVCAWEDEPLLLWEFLSAASVPSLLEFASSVTVALIEGRTAREVARIESLATAREEEPSTF